MPISLETLRVSRNWTCWGPTPLLLCVGSSKRLRSRTVRLSTRLPELYFSGGARVLRDCASVCVPASSLLSPSPLLQSCHRRCSRHRHRYRKIPICLSRKKTPERRCVRRPRGSASEWLIRDRRSLRSGFRQIGRSYEHEFEWPTFQFEPTLPSPKKSVPCLTLGFISRSPNASALTAELRLRRQGRF